MLFFLGFFFHENLLTKLTFRPLSYFVVLPPSPPSGANPPIAVSEPALTNSRCLQRFDTECNTCSPGLSSISEDTEWNF